MRKFLKLGDLIVVAIILLLTVILAIKPAFSDALFVVIHVDGKEYGRYSLTDNKKIIEISTDFGHNTVVISDGAVYVTQSSCKDKVEIKAGAISDVGQALVCLPNRVVVTVEGGAKTDATTF